MNQARTLFLCGVLATAPTSITGAQSTASTRPDSSRAPASATQAPTPRPWYERITLRGYAQIRYNRLLETNKELTCQQCDRSIGNNGGIFLRRGRLVLSGDVSNRLSFYVQPDYGSDAAGQQNYLQLRDAYFDLALDTKNSKTQVKSENRNAILTANGS